MGGGYGFSLAFALLHGNEVANPSRYKSYSLYTRIITNYYSPFPRFFILSWPS